MINSLRFCATLYIRPTVRLYHQTINTKISSRQRSIGLKLVAYHAPRLRQHPSERVYYYLLWKSHTR